MNLKLSAQKLKEISLLVSSSTREKLNLYYNELITIHSDTLLTYSRKKYERYGKGIVKIEMGIEARVKYLSYKKVIKTFEKVPGLSKQLSDILETYEPDSQFVVMISDIKGSSFLIHSKRHLK